MSANVRLLAKMQLEEYTLKTGQYSDPHIAVVQNSPIHSQSSRGLQSLSGTNDQSMIIFEVNILHVFAGKLSQLFPGGKMLKSNYFKGLKRRILKERKRE